MCCCYCCLSAEGEVGSCPHTPARTADVARAALETRNPALMQGVAVILAVAVAVSPLSDIQSLYQGLLYDRVGSSYADQQIRLLAGYDSRFRLLAEAIVWLLLTESDESAPPYAVTSLATESALTTSGCFLPSLLSAGHRSAWWTA